MCASSVVYMQELHPVDDGGVQWIMGVCAIKMVRNAVPSNN